MVSRRAKNWLGHARPALVGSRGRVALRVFPSRSSAVGGGPLLQTQLLLLARSCSRSCLALSMQNTPHTPVSMAVSSKTRRVRSAGQAGSRGTVAI